jgi:hypothetical protein
MPTIKRTEPITVVIGNPPYKDKAKGRGGWIERGSQGREAPLKRWIPPRTWGVGAHAKHLKNLYIYFWRWGTWKVFGTGLHASTGLEETDKAGIVCFITAAGFLGGDGFQKMRDDLRRSCHEIWVIDCSPEGHQPDVPTRIFQGVQQPVCIVLTARALGKGANVPAGVRFHALPQGRREDKFEALAKLSLTGSEWVDCAIGWRDPFLPETKGAWAKFPALEDLFVWSGSGVLPGRTWVVAPDAQSLRDRWDRLIAESSLVKKEELFFPTLRNGKVADRHIQKIVPEGLFGHEYRAVPVADDKLPVIEPIRFGFRSFDRQWIIPDNRLLLSARPILWNIQTASQVHLVSLEKRAPENGPSVTFSALLPDMNFYKGSSGGRVFPLWLNAPTTLPNFNPVLLTHLAKLYGQPVKAEDVMAYIAAVLAQPAFTARFADDLVRPGLRVPLTADAKLFDEAVTLGREVVWLHCYGERFADPAANRPKGPPRLPSDKAPRIPAEGAIPLAPEPLPDTMEYDASKHRLLVGKGYVENVTPEMWAYEVSGMNVLRQWFSYRKRDRSRPLIGDRRPPSPLDKIQPESWLPEYTTDLLDLLHVLGRLIALEPRQADLLDRICASRLLSAEELRAAGALAMPEAASGSGKKGKAPRKPRVIRGKTPRTARAAGKVRP